MTYNYGYVSFWITDVPLIVISENLNPFLDNKDDGFVSNMYRSIWSIWNQKYIFILNNFHGMTYRITLSRIGCIGSPIQYFGVGSTNLSCVKQSLKYA